MQKIKLNTVVYSNGRYVVYLDRDTRCYFTNKRKARDFLVQQSQRNDMAFLFITEALSSLIEFFSLFNIADSDYEFKYKVKNCIDYVQGRIEWISKQRTSDNVQALTMQYIVGCYSELVTGFTLIRDKAAARNDNIAKRRCELRIELVRLYSQQLIKVKSEASSEASGLRIV